MSVNPGFEVQQLGWKVLSQQALPWIGLWLLLVIVALFVRPLGSVDELKLLAVTWEMWQQGNFLLPVFNGFDAPEQPPLMPWFIHIGWTVFGVNDWWPRVLSALFSLMSLFIIGRISALLWMDQLKMPRYTAFILLGSWLWVFYLTVSLADNMLTFFTLLGLYGILHAWRYTTRAGWLIFGFATGCAVLSNGLMSLLYTMPVALLGPIWAGREHALRWTNWYIDMSTGLLVGLGLVGLWGLLIVIQVEQGTAIALDHVIGALPAEIGLFPKNQSTYSYLYFLPAALLPWIAWPLVYSRFWQIKTKPVALGVIFCLVWVVPILMVLSVLGPRQPQFLLPLLPAFALLIANLLFNEELIDHGEQRFSMSLLLPTLLLGISLAVAPMLASETWVPQSLKELSPAIGLSITAFVLLVIVLPASGFAGRMFFIFSGILLALMPTFPRIEQLPAVLWELPIYVGIGVALFGVALTWLP
ncbi:MAG: glycosyltransferase family 39 protein, partial [Acidiferrobacterales bacterium]